MPSELHTERHGATLVLTISDPPTLNTLSEQVFAAGIEALDVVESDPAVRCIVLRGEGAHFSAGGNLDEVLSNRQSGRPAQDKMLKVFHDLVEVLRVYPKPVIAAVEGAAAGAGFSLALSCDMIVAAEDAKFMMAYSKVGVTSDGGATWHLMQRLPRNLVLQLLWLAEPMTSQQLLAHGVVNWVSPKGEALNKALEIADRLARGAPGVIAGAKELVNQWPQNSFEQQLDAERAQFLDTLFHADGDEGLRAFLGKRAPRFS